MITPTRPFTARPHDSGAILTHFCPSAGTDVAHVITRDVARKLAADLLAAVEPAPVRGVDPADCRHARWSPGNWRCHDCGAVVPPAPGPPAQPCGACDGEGVKRVGDDHDYELFECGPCDGTGFAGGTR